MVHILLEIILCTFLLVLVRCIDEVLVTFTADELKGFNYNVDISQTPVKKGEEQSLSVMYMKSKYGQDYQCILPQLDEDEFSEKETVSEKSTDIKELLRPMQSGSCLLKGKDWWTYEFCFGHYIKQFHIEDGQIIGQVVTLGLYESDYDWNNETDHDKFKHVKQKYHSQYYANGSKCDLTGQPRNAEVRLYCEEDAGDYIYRVDEPGTCSYIVTVHTSRLCSHPQLKPLPSNKAHTIACRPLLNEEQYAKYTKQLNEQKALAEEKRNQWLNNQHERLQVMKNENSLTIEGEKVVEIKDYYKEITEESEAKYSAVDTDISEDNRKDEESSQSVTTVDDPNSKYKKIKSTVQSFLLKEFDKEIEKLKMILPPEKIASVKKDVQKQFDNILKEAEGDLDLELSDESKDKAFSKLTSTLNMLLEKLDKAEKDVTKQLNKVQSLVSEDAPKDEDPSDDNEKNEIEIDETLKVIKDDESQSAVLDDDKLHVRIRRLDRKATNSDGKLYEMDFVQRKKLEQAVKEKLEKAGLDTGGRRIEVKIITAGYYDNEDGKDFHSLSDEETSQFQNMIMAMLTGQNEAVQEVERHKKLEENYKFTWEFTDGEKED